MLCCNGGLAVNKRGWTLIDTLIALLIFSITASVIFLIINTTSKTVIKNSDLFNSNMNAILSEVLIKRILGEAGNGLPRTIIGSKGETTGSVSLSGYSETPQDFSGSGPEVKLIDGNNDDKFGFAYLVTRTLTNILLKDSPRWAVLSSTGSTFSVVSTSRYCPISGDIVAIINSTDGSAFMGKAYQIKSNIGRGLTDASFSDYGLPVLNMGRYIVYTVRKGTYGSTTNTTPYNRVDIVLTKYGVPDYCSKGSYNLSAMYIDTVNGKEVFIPILSCVAGFKVKFLIKSATGYTWIDSLKNKSAGSVNTEVRAVAVFLIYQSGKVQPNNATKSCVMSPAIYDINGRKVSVTINFGRYIPNCKRYLWRGMAFVVPVYATKDWL